MTEPGWRGGRNVFGGESCLNQLYKSRPLFVYTRTLCKEHGACRGKAKPSNSSIPIGLKMQFCIHSQQNRVNVQKYSFPQPKLVSRLILMCASTDSLFRERPSIARHVPPPISVIQVLPIAVYSPLSSVIPRTNSPLY